MFAVYEVDKFRHIQGPAHAFFSNKNAALSYLKECFTPKYDRYLALIEHNVIDEWPISVTNVRLDKIEYFYQLNGKIEKETSGL